MFSHKLFSQNLKRFLSLFVALCFFVSDISAAAPMQSAVFKPSAALENKISGLTSSFSLPSHLGKVEFLHQAFAQAPLILHLQTMHGHYETATKVREIMAYLKDHYGAGYVFAEGAKGELNGEYLNFVDDVESNRDVLDLLARRGELTGVDLAVNLSGFTGIGIESAELYREGYGLFKEVMARSSENADYLEELKLEIDKRATVSLSSEAREHIKHWLDFSAGTKDFFAAIRFLQNSALEKLELDLKDPFSQFEWPQLTRLALLQSLEKKLNEEEIAGDAERLSLWLESKQLSSSFVDWVLNLSAQDLSRQNVRGEIEGFLSEVMDKGFRFEDYPGFTYRVAYRVLESELDAVSLVEEMETLFSKLLESLLSSTEARAIYEEYKAWDLLSKLLTLELSLNEWQQAREITFNIENKSVAESVANAGQFYDVMLQREDAFFQTITDSLESRESKVSVLVTGGFHSEGMRQRLTDAGLSYVLISPHVSGDLNHSLYQKIMTRGDQLEQTLLTIDPMIASHEFGWPVAVQQASVRQGIRDSGYIAELTTPYFSRVAAALAERPRAELRRNAPNNPWLTNPAQADWDQVSAAQKRWLVNQALSESGKSPAEVLNDEEAARLVFTKTAIPFLDGKTLQPLYDYYDKKRKDLGDPFSTTTKIFFESGFNFEGREDIDYLSSIGEGITDAQRRRFTLLTKQFDLQKLLRLFVTNQSGLFHLLALQDSEMDHNALLFLLSQHFWKYEDAHDVKDFTFEDLKAMEGDLAKFGHSEQTDLLNKQLRARLYRGLLQEASVMATQNVTAAALELVIKRFDEYAQHPQLDAKVKSLYESIRDFYQEIEKADYQQFVRHKDAAGKTFYLDLHQLEGIHFARQKSKVIIGDEMGVGKTPQAIATMVAAGTQRGILITPKSLMGMWKAEIKQWLGSDDDVVVLKGTRKEKIQMMQDIVDGKIKARFVIVNFAGIRSDDKDYFELVEKINAWKPDFKVGDEVHRIRNPSSKQSRAYRKIRADNILNLSGTSIVNNWDDFWALLNDLNPEEFKIRAKFLKRFSNNALSFVRLNALLGNNYFIRRTHEDVMLELPPRAQTHQVSIELDDEQKAEYQAALAAYHDKKNRFDILKAQQHMRQIVIDLDLRHKRKSGAYEHAEPPKHKAALHIIKGLNEIIPEENRVKPDEKVVVYSYYNHVVKRQKELIEAELGEGSVAMIDKDMNETQRLEQVERFQNDPKVKVFLATFGVGSEGLTLTRGNHVIFIDLPYTKAEMDQAIGRVHRKGQTRQVQVHALVAEGTLDERNLAILERKETIFDQVINGMIRMDEGLKKEQWKNAQEIDRDIRDATDAYRARAAIGPAYKASIAGETKESLAAWEEAAALYSDQIERLAAFPLSQAFFLLLIELHKQGKIVLSPESHWFFMPSGPATDLRALATLEKQFKEIGLNIHDLTYTNGDFSPEMLFLGAQALNKVGGFNFNNRLVNAVEDELPAHVYDFADSSELAGFSASALNSHGVTHKNWHLGQLIKSLKKDGLLLLWVHNGKVEDKAKEFLTKNFGLEIISGDGVRLPLQGLSAAMRRKLNNASFVLARATDTTVEITGSGDYTELLKKMPKRGFVISKDTDPSVKLSFVEAPAFTGEKAPDINDLSGAISDGRRSVNFGRDDARKKPLAKRDEKLRKHLESIIRLLSRTGEEGEARIDPAVAIREIESHISEIERSQPTKKFLDYVKSAVDYQLKQNKADWEGYLRSLEEIAARLASINPYQVNSGKKKQKRSEVKSGDDAADEEGEADELPEDTPQVKSVSKRITDQNDILIRWIHEGFDFKISPMPERKGLRLEGNTFWVDPYIMSKGLLTNAEKTWLLTALTHFYRDELIEKIAPDLSPQAVLISGALLWQQAASAQKQIMPLLERLDPAQTDLFALILQASSLPSGVIERIQQKSGITDDSVQADFKTYFDFIISHRSGSNISASETAANDVARVLNVPMEIPQEITDETIEGDSDRAELVKTLINSLLPFMNYGDSDSKDDSRIDADSFEAPFYQQQIYGQQRFYKPGRFESAIESMHRPLLESYFTLEAFPEVRDFIRRFYMALLPELAPVIRDPEKFEEAFTGEAGIDVLRDALKKEYWRIQAVKRMVNATGIDSRQDVADWANNFKSKSALPTRYSYTVIASHLLLTPHTFSDWDLDIIAAQFKDLFAPSDLAGIYDMSIRSIYDEMWLGDYRIVVAHKEVDGKKYKRLEALRQNDGKLVAYFGAGEDNNELFQRWNILNPATGQPLETFIHEEPVIDDSQETLSVYASSLENTELLFTYDENRGFVKNLPGGSYGGSKIGIAWENFTPDLIRIDDREGGSHAFLLYKDQTGEALRIYPLDFFEESDTHRGEHLYSVDLRDVSIRPVGSSPADIDGSGKHASVYLEGRESAENLILSVSALKGQSIGSGPFALYRALMINPEIEKLADQGDRDLRWLIDTLESINTPGRLPDFMPDEMDAAEYLHFAFFGPRSEYPDRDKKNLKSEYIALRNALKKIILKPSSSAEAKLLAHQFFAIISPFSDISETSEKAFFKTFQSVKLALRMKASKGRIAKKYDSLVNLSAWRASVLESGEKERLLSLPELAAMLARWGEPARLSRVSEDALNGSFLKQMKVKKIRTLIPDLVSTHISIVKSDERKGNDLILVGELKNGRINLARMGTGFEQGNLMGHWYVMNDRLKKFGHSESSEKATDPEKFDWYEQYRQTEGAPVLDREFWINEIQSGRDRVLQNYSTYLSLDDLKADGVLIQNYTRQSPVGRRHLHVFLNPYDLSEVVAYAVNDELEHVPDVRGEIGPFFKFNLAGLLGRRSYSAASLTFVGHPDGNGFYIEYKEGVGVVDAKLADASEFAPHWYSDSIYKAGAVTVESVEDEIEPDQIRPLEEYEIRYFDIPVEFLRGDGVLILNYSKHKTYNTLGDHLHVFEDPLKPGQILVHVLDGDFKPARNASRKVAPRSRFTIQGLNYESISSLSFKMSEKRDVLKVSSTNGSKIFRAKVNMPGQRAQVRPDVEEHEVWYERYLNTLDAPVAETSDEDALADLIKRKGEDLFEVDLSLFEGDGVIVEHYSRNGREGRTHLHAFVSPEDPKKILVYPLTEEYKHFQKDGLSPKPLYTLMLRKPGPRGAPFVFPGGTELMYLQHANAVSIRNGHAGYKWNVKAARLLVEGENEADEISEVSDLEKVEDIIKVSYEEDPETFGQSVRSRFDEYYSHFDHGESWESVHRPLLAMLRNENTERTAKNVIRRFYAALLPEDLDLIKTNGTNKAQITQALEAESQRNLFERDEVNYWNRNLDPDGVRLEYEVHSFQRLSEKLGGENELSLMRAASMMARSKIPMGFNPETEQALIDLFWQLHGASMGDRFFKEELTIEYARRTFPLRYENEGWHRTEVMIATAKGIPLARLGTGYDIDDLQGRWHIQWQNLTYQLKNHQDSFPSLVDDTTFNLPLKRGRTLLDLGERSNGIFVIRNPDAQDESALFFSYMDRQINAESKVYPLAGLNLQMPGSHVQINDTVFEVLEDGRIYYEKTDRPAPNKTLKTLFAFRDGAYLRGQDLAYIHSGSATIQPEHVQSIVTDEGIIVGPEIFERTVNFAGKEVRNGFYFYVSANQHHHDVLVVENPQNPREILFFEELMPGYKTKPTLGRYPFAVLRKDTPGEVTFHGYKFVTNGDGTYFIDTTKPSGRVPSIYTFDVDYRKGTDEHEVFDDRVVTAYENLWKRMLSEDSKDDLSSTGKRSELRLDEKALITKLKQKGLSKKQAEWVLKILTQAIRRLTGKYDGKTWRVPNDKDYEKQVKARIDDLRTVKYGNGVLAAYQTLFVMRPVIEVLIDSKKKQPHLYEAISAELWNVFKSRADLADAFETIHMRERGYKGWNSDIKSIFDDEDTGLEKYEEVLTERARQVRIDSDESLSEENHQFGKELGQLLVLITNKNYEQAYQILNLMDTGLDLRNAVLEVIPDYERSEKRLTKKIIESALEELGLRGYAVGEINGEFAVYPDDLTLARRPDSDLSMLESKLRAKFSSYRYSIIDDRRTGDRDDIRLDINKPRSRRSELRMNDVDRKYPLSFQKSFEEQGAQLFDSLKDSGASPEIIPNYERSEKRLTKKLIQSVLEELGVRGYAVGEINGEFAVYPEDLTLARRPDSDLSMLESKLRAKFSSYRYSIIDDRRTGDRDDIRLDINKPRTRRSELRMSGVDRKYPRYFRKSFEEAKTQLFDYLKDSGASLEVYKGQFNAGYTGYDIALHSEDWDDVGLSEDDAAYVPVVTLGAGTDPDTVFDDLINVTQFNGYVAGTNRFVSLNDDFAVKTAEGYSLNAKEMQLRFLKEEFVHQSLTFGGTPFARPVAILKYYRFNAPSYVLVEEVGWDAVVEIVHAVKEGHFDWASQIVERTAELMRFMVDAGRVPSQFDPFVDRSGRIFLVDDYPHRQGGTAEIMKSSVKGWIEGRVRDDVELLERLGEEELLRISSNLIEAFDRAYENAESQERFQRMFEFKDELLRTSERQEQRTEFASNEVLFLDLLQMFQNLQFPEYADDRGDPVKTADGTFLPSDIVMTAQILKEVIKGGEHVIDLGSGSGTVLFTALGLGAGYATGYETDAGLVQSAQGIFSALLEADAFGDEFDPNRLRIFTESFLDKDFKTINADLDIPSAQNIYYYFDVGSAAELDDPDAFAERLKDLPEGSLLVIHFRNYLTDENFEDLELVKKIPHTNRTASYIYRVPVRSESRKLEEDFRRRYIEEFGEDKLYNVDAAQFNQDPYRSLYDAVAGLFGVSRDRTDERLAEGKRLLEKLYAQPDAEALLEKAVKHLARYSFVASSSHRFAPIGLAIRNHFLNQNLFEYPDINLEEIHPGFAYLKRMHPFYAEGDFYHRVRPKFLPRLKLEPPRSSRKYRVLDVGSAPKESGSPTLNLLRAYFDSDAAFAGKDFEINGTDIFFPLFAEEGQLIRDRQPDASRVINNVTYHLVSKADENGLYTADVMHPDFEKQALGRFDYITMAATLHHLTKPQGESFGVYPLADVELIKPDGSYYDEEYYLALSQQQVLTRLLNSLNDRGVFFLNLTVAWPNMLPDELQGQPELLEKFLQQHFESKANADNFIVIQRIRDRFVVHDKVIPFRPGVKFWDGSHYLLSEKNDFYTDISLLDLYPQLTEHHPLYQEATDLFRRADMLVYWHQSLNKSRWGSVKRAASVLKQRGSFLKILKAYLKNVPDSEKLKYALIEDAMRLEEKLDALAERKVFEDENEASPDELLLKRFSHWSFRFFDIATVIVLALPALLISLPIAAFIKLSDIKSPLFYTQERVGFQGRLISISKFRTMNESGEPIQLFGFPLGKALRVSALDEIPQLLSVLKGDMAVLGPRPVTATELTRDVLMSIYKFRKPGFFSLHSAKYGAGRGLNKTPDGIELYVRDHLNELHEWNRFTPFKILGLTGWSFVTSVASLITGRISDSEVSDPDKKPRSEHRSDEDALQEIARLAYENETYDNPDNQRLYELLVRYLNLRKESTVEIGPGTNLTVSRALLDYGVQNVNVVDIPHIVKQVKDADERVAAHAGDVMQLPFENGSQDAVIFNQSLHFVESYKRFEADVFKRALMEADRVLKPGGWLLIKPGHHFSGGRQQAVSEAARLSVLIKAMGYENVHTLRHQYSSVFIYAQKPQAQKSELRTIQEQIAELWPEDQGHSHQVEVNETVIQTTFAQNYILIDDFLFIEPETWQAYREELAPYREQIILTHFMRGMLSRQAGFLNGSHTANAIYMMIAAGDLFKGKVVLDAGSGDGVLSALASRLGAKEVIGIENGPHSLKRARAVLAMGLDSNISLIEGDVRQAKELLGDQAIDIIVANLNPADFVDGDRYTDWHVELMHKILPEYYFYLGAEDLGGGLLDSIVGYIESGAWHRVQEFKSYARRGRYHHAFLFKSVPRSEQRQLHPSDRIEEILRAASGTDIQETSYQGKQREYKIKRTSAYFRVGDFVYVPEAIFRTHEKALRPLMSHLIVTELNSYRDTSLLEFGSHDYTLSAILALMEKSDVLQSARVLDAGFGVGAILSLTMKRLGAREVVGVDSNEDNLQNALMYRELNEFENMRFLHRNFKAVDETAFGEFDLVISNLNAWGFYLDREQGGEYNWNQRLLQALPGSTHWLFAGAMNVGHAPPAFQEAVSNEFEKPLETLIEIDGFMNQISKKVAVFYGVRQRSEARSVTKYIPPFEVKSDINSRRLPNQIAVYYGGGWDSGSVDLMLQAYPRLEKIVYVDKNYRGENNDMYRANILRNLLRAGMEVPQETRQEILRKRYDDAGKLILKLPVNGGEREIELVLYARDYSNSMDEIRAAEAPDGFGLTWIKRPTEGALNLWADERIEFYTRALTYAADQGILFVNDARLGERRVLRPESVDMLESSEKIRDDVSEWLKGSDEMLYVTKGQYVIFRKRKARSELRAVEENVPENLKMSALNIPFVIEPSQMDGIEQVTALAALGIMDVDYNASQSNDYRLALRRAINDYYAKRGLNGQTEFLPVIELLRSNKKIIALAAHIRDVNDKAALEQILESAQLLIEVNQAKAHYVPLVVSDPADLETLRDDVMDYLYRKYPLDVHKRNQLYRRLPVLSLTDRSASKLIPRGSETVWVDWFDSSETETKAPDYIEGNPIHANHLLNGQILDFNDQNRGFGVSLLQAALLLLEGPEAGRLSLKNGIYFQSGRDGFLNLGQILAAMEVLAASA